MYGSDRYSLAAKLDSNLKLRMLVQALSSVAAAAIIGITIKARQEIDDDEQTIATKLTGRQLDKGKVKDSTLMIIFLTGTLAVYPLIFILYLKMRWHHPSQTNPQGRFKKSRPILLTILTGKSFVVALILAAAATTSIAIKEAKLIPDSEDSKALAESVGVKLEYIKHPFFLAAIALCGVLAIINLACFVLELASYIKFKRGSRDMEDSSPDGKSII